MARGGIPGDQTWHSGARYNTIKALNDKAASILVVGAGFIGVEWVTELQHFFPKLKLTIIDFLPQPLGPLPKSAATYCETRTTLGQGVGDMLRSGQEACRGEAGGSTSCHSTQSPAEAN